MLGLCLLVSHGVAVFAQETAQRVNDDGVEGISPALCVDMKRRHVLNPGAPVGCERLSLVKFSYIGFDGEKHRDGQLVVLDALADHVFRIFEALRERQFPIARARLMNEFDGNDEASMDNNNTSSFNVRRIIGGGSISMHAYGAAIDLNPLQNPYLKRSAELLSVSPKAGGDYLNRKNFRPGMAEAVVDLFAQHGFSVWGGYWHRGTIREIEALHPIRL
jgi:D-alanyl-D-alanine carboxypeptidase